jgi:glycerate 2-kinase
VGQVLPPILSHAEEGRPVVATPRDRVVSRVVVAPNAFKGSLSARAAAEAMARGVASVVPGAHVTLMPVADGGDGSVDAFVAAGFTRIPVEVRGPTGQSTSSAFAMRDTVAVVELADACGFARLPDGIPAPLTSSTLGLGDAIRAALDAGARSILACLGGSASTDGGAGVLVALGARLLDDHDADLVPCGASLPRVARIDLSGLDPRLGGCPITALVDVGSPLFGPDGAAMVFAPQKGADATQVAELDAGLRTWSAAVVAATGRDVAGVPGSGAAGGTAAGMLAALTCEIRSGADVIADLVGLDEQIARADLVITGEGRLDDQSPLGKGVVGVAARAGAAGVPVIAVCGALAISDRRLRELGFAGWTESMSYAIDMTDAVARADELVAIAASDAIRDWLGD